MNSLNTNSILEAAPTTGVNTDQITEKLLDGEHDIIIAELLVAKHKDNILFDTSRKEWKVFQNGVWHEAEDAANLVWDFYYQIILDIFHGEYPEIEAGEPKWLKNQMNQSKVNAVLKVVQIRTAKGVKKLNANHNLIGIQDSVFDIEAGSVRPAVASDLVMKSLGTTYDPDAKCPLWERFLDTSMQSDQDMIKYLQRLVGYFLTASTKEQEIYYFYGKGANGKSTFIDLVKSLLGTYGVKVSSDSFMQKRSSAPNLGAQASLATLAGARLAITDETNDNETFNAQMLKSISGDEEITGRFLRGNPITFKSTAKIVMYGNDKPYGNINDEGFWRRFRFIEFGHVVPDSQKDKNLLHKLKAELPGILNWALAGLADWRKNGIQTPKKVLDERDSYREGLDTVSKFLKENTKEAAGQRLTTKQLFEYYKKWCETNLEPAETNQAFSRRTAWYFDTNMKGKVKPYRSNKDRGYTGIQFDEQYRLVE
jgi:putative DNA primase/helicase